MNYSSKLNDTLMIPLFLLFASSDSEDPMRTFRGPNEVVSGKQRGQIEVIVSNIPRFRLFVTPLFDHRPKKFIASE